MGASTAIPAVPTTDPPTTATTCSTGTTSTTARGGRTARRPRRGGGFEDARRGGFDGVHPEDLDIDHLPPGRLDDFNPLGGLEEAPRRHVRPAPPRGPRRPSPVRTDVDHVMVVDDRPMADAGGIDANDAVLRVLADLDFDPKVTSVKEVEQLIADATGAETDEGRGLLAEREDIDRVAFVAGDAADTSAPGDKGQNMFISDILADLIDED